MLDPARVESFKADFERLNPNACCWDDEELTNFIIYLYSRAFKDGEEEMEHWLRDPDNRG